MILIQRFLSSAKCSGRSSRAMPSIAERLDALERIIQAILSLAQAAPADRTGWRDQLGFSGSAFAFGGVALFPDVDLPRRS